MIEIFNELYTLLKTALTTYDSDIKMSSVYTNTPSEYPFVSFEELNDSVYEQGSDCCEIENFANKDYEVNIYTKEPNKKSNADKICQVVDTFMKSKGFIRMFKNSMQTTNETTYRIIVRYNGVVSKEKVIYRR